MRHAWRLLETTKERVQVNREAIQSAEENVSVASNRYNQGAGTNTEVLDAETLRTATYTNYYSSVYAAVQYLMELSRAVGDFSVSGMGLGIDASELPTDLPRPPENQP